MSALVDVRLSFAFVHVLAFVFMDANANDDSDLPDELKQKYTIAKLLGRYKILT